MSLEVDLIPAITTDYFIYYSSSALPHIRTKQLVRFLSFSPHPPLHTPSSNPYIAHMIMATILTDSPSYDEATNIGLFVLLGMLLVSMLAFIALPHVFVHGACHNESLEMGLSAQFTSFMPSIKTEDGSRDSTPEDSLSVRSAQAAISHLGDTDSEWLEETPDISSRPSEEDITNAFALTAMLSTSGSGFWYGEDANPWNDQPGDESLGDSLPEA